MKLKYSKNIFRILQTRNLSLYIILLTSVLFFGCGSGESGSSGGSITLKSPAFPEIQVMHTKVAAFLDIAGQTCELGVKPDTKLEGKCTGIPLGSHSYTLIYTRPDFGALLGTVEGNVTLVESGEPTEISLPPVSKNYDYDADSYSNLIEVMYGTDHRNPSSIPTVPSYAPVSNYKVGEEPSELALGDLNKDGIMDVVSTNWASDSLSVLLGKNDGTFQTAVEYPMGPVGPDPRNPEDIVLGDLNGDSNLDVVMINSGTMGGFSGDLAVFLGNGNGTLKMPETQDYYPVGDEPVSVAIGHLNTDGYLDVVIGNFRSKNISVHLGNGDGTLQSAIFSPTGAVFSIALGDLNGDPFLDVITSNLDTQTIGVLLGNGDGKFQDQVSFQTQGLIANLALGDLNGDSRLDLIAAILFSNVLEVYLGNGDGTFQAPSSFETGNNPASLALVDLDKDGFLDVVTENQEGEVIAVLLGKGNGSLQEPAFYEIGNSPSTVVIGDLNKDGLWDIFSTSRTAGTVAVLLSN